MSTAVLERFVESLPESLRARVRRDVKLAPFTSYRIGGPASVFVEATCDDDVIEVRRLCAYSGVPMALLGNGSNVIAPDAGIDGVVLKLGAAYSGLRVVDADTFYAEAGTLLERLSRHALDKQRSGLEWMVDIPGSLGGAVLMNAGNNDGEMRTNIESVRFLDASGEVRECDRSELGMAYRQSRFKGSQEIVLGAYITLGANDAQKRIAERMQLQRETRARKFPMEFPNAGSVFKRPIGHYAGKLIEDSGLKGLRVGGAEVSTKHAGFIVNCGNATATDILGLVQAVQSKVLEMHGVQLEMEQVPLQATLLHNTAV